MIQNHIIQEYKKLFDTNETQLKREFSVALRLIIEYNFG